MALTTTQAIYQETLRTAAAPGTTWTPVSPTAFGAGHMLIIAVMTDGTAAPQSVSVTGAEAALIFSCVNSTLTGHLSLWHAQATYGGDGNLKVTWAAGPANAALRVHEMSPLAKQWGTGSWTQGGGSSGSSPSPTTGAFAPVFNGMKIAGLATQGTVTSESGTQELWNGYAITAGAFTGHYAIALSGTTANASTYTWNQSSGSNYFAMSAVTNAPLYDPDTITSFVCRKPVGAIGEVKVPTNARTPVLAKPPLAIRRDNAGNNTQSLQQPNSAKQGIDIPVLTTDGALRSITGHVYDVNHNPVQGAVVHLFRQWDDFLMQTTTTDVNGAYAFPRDAQDPWTYYVVGYSSSGAVQIHGTSDRSLAPS